MNFVERFKARKMFDPVVMVETSIPTLKLRVNRFVEAEHEVARQHARKMLREEGIDPATAKPMELGAAYAMALAVILARHVVGWEDSTGSLEYSKVAFEQMFAEMDANDRAVLALSYLGAVADAEKKIVPTSTDGEQG